MLFSKKILYVAATEVAVTRPADIRELFQRKDVESPAGQKSAEDNERAENCRNTTTSHVDVAEADAKNTKSEATFQFSSIQWYQTRTWCCVQKLSAEEKRRLIDLFRDSNSIFQLTLERMSRTDTSAINGLPTICGSCIQQSATVCFLWFVYFSWAVLFRDSQLPRSLWILKGWHLCMKNTSSSALTGLLCQAWTV